MAITFFPLAAFPPPDPPEAPAASVSGLPHSGQEKSPPPLAIWIISRLSALLQSPKLMHFPVRSAISNLLYRSLRRKRLAHIPIRGQTIIASQGQDGNRSAGIERSGSRRPGLGGFPSRR